MRQPFWNETRRQALREMREGARVFQRGLRHPDSVFVLSMVGLLLIDLVLFRQYVKEQAANEPSRIRSMAPY
ncbi:MAG: hypothetical protein HY567_04525 [Candidatus Kerfeldbacteria bacterium]|nr:hypothetical protein [Candidatus Kerfeldbacteria bacterium]